MSTAAPNRDPRREHPAGMGDCAATGLREVAERRLARMREGMSWVRHVHPQLIEAYGSVVDLDFGWRMVDATLRRHREGTTELAPDCHRALTELWQTLTTEIIRTPNRDQQGEEQTVARELGEAVQERLHRMRQAMERDDALAIRMMRDYEALIDLDLGWRMIEASLADSDSGETPLDAEQRESLEAQWRELTTELVAVLSRSDQELERRPVFEAPFTDNTIPFTRAA